MAGIGSSHRRWWSAGVVVAVAVAAFLVVPALLPGPERPAVTAVAVGSAEPPTWDEVLALRDGLAADAVAAVDYPLDAATLAAVPTAPGPYTPLGRIQIDAIGLDVQYAAGVHPSVLERGPGHWPGTAAAGQAGNAVISGHRTTYTAPFGDLDLLVAGDTITVQDTAGSAVTFRVTDTTVVPESEYREFVLREPADPTARRLTLFACAPKGDRTHRIVVRALAEEGG
ncbi:MAG: class E sortase [Pseudonocardia sp.]|nr:class E sortase [Pseudonocardia sp.]